MAHTALASLRTYADLTKPRLLPMVLFTGLPVFGMAAGGWTSLPFAGLTLLGIALFCTCYFGLLERTERTARLRVALAFAFGLVHGFGFAGVLAELELPTHRLAPALFGFNVGVELGQLAAVALFWPLLRALARFGLVAETASAAVCGLGLFWFATRAYG